MKRWQEEFEGIKKTHPEAILTPTSQQERDTVLKVADRLLHDDIIIALANIVSGGLIGSHNNMVEEVDTELVGDSTLVYADYKDIMDSARLRGRTAFGADRMEVFFRGRRIEMATPLIRTLRVFFIARGAVITPTRRKRFNVKTLGDPIGICMKINGELFAASFGTLMGIIRAIDRYTESVDAPRKGLREMLLGRRVAADPDFEPRNGRRIDVTRLKKGRKR